MTIVADLKERGFVLHPPNIQAAHPLKQGLKLGKKKDQIRQTGNAVCPPVARAIAAAIKELER